jgi:hypothetical protein
MHINILKNETKRKNVSGRIIRSDGTKSTDNLGDFSVSNSGIPGTRRGLTSSNSESNIKNKVQSIEGESPKNVVNTVRKQRGLITLSEQEVLKYARAGIESQYDSQAIKQIGLQGVKFTKEDIQAKIKESLDKLIKNSDSYIMSEDSKAVDGAIQYEINTLINDGASEAAVENAKKAFEPGAMRESFIDSYKKAQKETLEQWKSYLSQSDYSDSFKYLMLDAVLTNNYDFKTNKYTKRTNKTIRNFTPFDAGTLAALYANDSKSLLKDYVEIQAENASNIIESSSFVSTKEGEWIKFDGGASVSPEIRLENANKLSQIVQNTYWCTKTNAKSQLQYGDFYVYATKDSNGEYESRIAVRMEGDKVGEVRGNASSKQDLEADMMPVADKFLKENIPNGSGQKWLNSIEYNTKVKELTEKIEGVKINEELLKEYFDIIKDADKFKVDFGENGLVTKLKNVFDGAEFNFPVARNLRELRPNTLLFIGNFIPISQVKSNIFPKYITGNANFWSSNVTDLGNLTSIEGNADFKDSKVTDLGDLQSIGGNADFKDSKVADLGSLQSIGGGAYFVDSKITDLGSLNSIGGGAYFGYSKITDLGNLKSIGEDAYFKYSQVVNLGDLQSIGGNADFIGSKITDLGSLQSIGGKGNFRDSKVTDLGNLQSIGGSANFKDSQITDLGNLQSIGRNADFKDSQITDLGSLQSIGGFANFSDSQITDLGSLNSIGGGAYFSQSQITNLKNLKSIGATARFEYSKVTDLGNLKSIGGRVHFGNNIKLEEEWNNRKSKTQTRKQKSTPQSRKQKTDKTVKVGDDVKVTKETYNNGKRVTTTQAGKLIKINDDGTYDIRKGKLIYTKVRAISIEKFIPSVSVVSETEGLTKNEQNKQGISELLSAIREQNRERLESIVSEMKVKIDEQRTKLKDFKERKIAISSFAKELLKGLSKSGIKYIPISKITAIINQIQNANTTDSLQKSADKLIETIQKISVTQKEIDLANSVSKAKKDLKTKSKKNGFGAFSQLINNLSRLDETSMKKEDGNSYKDLVVKISTGNYKNISELMDEVSSIIDKYNSQFDIQENVITDSQSEKANQKRGKMEAEAVLTKIKLPKDASPTMEEQEAIDILNSITSEEIGELTDSELSSFINTVNGLNKGVIASIQKLKEKILKIREAKKLASAFDKINFSNLIKRFFIDPIKLFKNKKSNIGSSFSPNIDSFFSLKGNVLSKFLSNFEDSYAMYEYNMSLSKASLGEIYGKISSFANTKNRKKRRIADIKIFMYAILKQFEENPQSKVVHSLEDFYNETLGNKIKIKEYEEKVGVESTKIVIELYEKYTNKATSQDIWNDMSREEKSAYNAMRLELEDTVSKAQKIKGLDRSELLTLVNHYFSYPVLAQQELTAEQHLDKVENGLISTKAGVIKDRQTKASPINFSASKSFLATIDQVNKDYYLGEPLRIELGALKILKEKFKNNKNSDYVSDFINNIKEQRGLLFESSSSSYSRLTNEIQSAAYKYLLGRVTRGAAEFLTNTTRILFKNILLGKINPVKYRALFKDKNKVNSIIKALGSTHIKRLLSGEALGGYGDAFVTMGDNYDLDFSQRSFTDRIASGLKDLGIVNSIISKKTIESPDKFFSRREFILELASRFKEETGKEIDFEKISNKDKEYLNENKKALSDARFNADQEVTAWFSTTNTSQKPKNQLKAMREGGLFNRIKYFMLPFLLQESQSLQKSIVNKGVTGGVQRGVPIITGMVAYQVYMEAFSMVFTQAITSAMSYFYDDEEEYELIKKLLEEKSVQRGFVAALIEIGIVRHFNGVSRIPLNLIIEIFNKHFGEELGVREEGEKYDKYKSIVYNKVDLERGMQGMDVISAIAPEFAPLVGGIEGLSKAALAKDKTRKQKEKRNYYLMKSFLTTLSALGILPRDVRDSFVYYKNRNLILGRDISRDNSTSLKSESSTRKSGGSESSVRKSAGSESSVRKSAGSESSVRK